MRVFKSLAVVAALFGGAVMLPEASSAAPVAPSAGLSAAPAGALVETVQYWGPGYGYGYRRPFYGPRPIYRRPFYGPRRIYRRRFYGPRPFYGRRFYGPPVVCRFRPSPFGPRRVCFRRY